MMSGENNNRTTTKTNVVPPSCNAKRGFLQCKSMVFARQKPYFCSTKRWFFAKHCHTNSYAILFFSYFVSIVGIAISLCIFTVTHVFPRSPRRRRGPIYRVRVPENRLNGVAFFHRWYCNSLYHTHVIPQNGVAIRIISIH